MTDIGDEQKKGRHERGGRTTPIPFSIQRNSPPLFLQSDGIGASSSLGTIFILQNLMEF
jgi:hypothetical protein